MQAIFNNPRFQKQFEQAGYLVVGQFLDKLQLDALQALFQKYKAQYAGPFHTSHFSSDIAYKQEAHNIISEVVSAAAGKYLCGFEPLFGNFMIKNPDPDAGMDMHADWTYVDETVTTSVAIWAPLIDVNEENGCLGVIEGSHQIANLIRGPLIRQSSRNHEKSWEKSFGKLLPMKAGDAVIYNHRLLHYSWPNKTKSIRPAINLSLAPAGTGWIHYCIPEGKAEIQMHQVPDSNFFINYGYLQSPDMNTLIKKLPPETVKYIDPVMKMFRFIKWKNAINKWFN